MGFACDVLSTRPERVLVTHDQARTVLPTYHELLAGCMATCYLKQNKFSMSHRFLPDLKCSLGASIFNQKSSGVQCSPMSPVLPLLFIYYVVSIHEKLKKTYTVNKTINAQIYNTKKWKKKDKLSCVLWFPLDLIELLYTLFECVMASAGFFYSI